MLSEVDCPSLERVKGYLWLFLQSLHSNPNKELIAALWEIGMFDTKPLSLFADKFPRPNSPITDEEVRKWYCSAYDQYKARFYKKLQERPRFYERALQIGLDVIPIEIPNEKKSAEDTIRTLLAEAEHELRSVSGRRPLLHEVRRQKLWWMFRLDERKYPASETVETVETPEVEPEPVSAEPDFPTDDSGRGITKAVRDVLDDAIAKSTLQITEETGRPREKVCKILCYLRDIGEVLAVEDGWILKQQTQKARHKAPRRRPLSLTTRQQLIYDILNEMGRPTSQFRIIDEVLQRSKDGDERAIEMLKPCVKSIGERKKGGYATNCALRQLKRKGVVKSTEDQKRKRLFYWEIISEVAAPSL
jgi:hypothetical protein